MTLVSDKFGESYYICFKIPKFRHLEQYYGYHR